MDAKTGESMGCPVDRPTTARSLLGRTNRDWWPEALPTDILHQGGVSPDPMGEDFDYAEAFKKLDYQALKSDLKALMTDSKPWCRPTMAITAVHDPEAWHAAGTYRPPTGAAAPIAGSSALPHCNSCRTTATSTRRVACCGRSSGSTARNIMGRPFILAGNVASKTWAARSLASAEVVPRVRARARLYWGARRSGSATAPKTRIQPDGNWSSSIPLARSDGPESTSIRRAGRTPTRCSRRGTSR